MADGRLGTTICSRLPGRSADPGVQRRIDSFMESVDRRYLFRYGYTRDQVLAVNGVDFSSIDQIREEHTEQNLGSVVADAYLYAAARADGQEGKGADVAIVPGGTLRETYAKGPITVEDVSSPFPLGSGRTECRAIRWSGPG